MAALAMARTMLPVLPFKPYCSFCPTLANSASPNLCAWRRLQNFRCLRLQPLTHRRITQLHAQLAVQARVVQTP